MADKPQFSKPASQLDLEARQAEGNRSFRELSTSDTYQGGGETSDGGRVFTVEGNKVDQYVGTSPEYATYANKTEAPLASGDSNPEAVVFDEFAASAVPATLKVDGNVEYEGEKAAAEAAKAKVESDDESDDEEEEEPTGSTPASSTPAK